MKLRPRAGGLTIVAAAYRLDVVEGRTTIGLSDGDGNPWADLQLLSAVNTIDARDETTAVGAAEVERGGGAVRLAWPVSSTRWRSKRVTVTCDDDGLTIDVEVEGEGEGRLGEVAFLGGWSLLPRLGTGWIESGAGFGSIVAGAPTIPGRLVGSASERVHNAATGGAEPGRAGWFFSPGPLCVAVSREGAAAKPRDGAGVVRGSWLAIGVGAGRDVEGFNGLTFAGAPGSFHLTLDYEGHTAVAGRWRSPAIRIAPTADPYAGFASYRAWLAARGLVPVVVAAPAGVPSWWQQPMFCGWGAQCAAAMASGAGLAGAANLATMGRYDEFLGKLEAAGIVPGTVVIDDKWEAHYGTGEPDATKWPDLAGWIARRHGRGQRVLLWWKAWDAEGFPPEACIRGPDGTPIAVDPDHPEGEALLRAAVRRVLAANGLDADGLKFDFTARTPSGAALHHHGPHWGLGLLRRLLEVIRDEAKRAKPDALLIGQVAEPTLAPLLDMIRLNDMLRLDDPEPRIPIVAEMTHRAAIVRAAAPNALIDTDDWCVPDRAEWRAWARAKPTLGVPSLYYVDRLDLSGEPLGPVDHALIRRTWATYRRAAGLPEPTASAR